jgi:hypothetical protein
MNDQFPNSGILFRNDKKESEKSPDYRGNATVGGQEFWISAWIREGRKGKFLSLSFKPKEVRKLQPSASNAASSRPPTPTASAVPGRSAEVEPDDIPFRTRIYKDAGKSRLNRRVL